MTNQEKKNELDFVITNLSQKGIKHNDNYDIVGIGNVVESVLSSCGITEDKFKEWFNIKQCGCSERKKWLNGIFHWKKLSK